MNINGDEFCILNIQANVCTLTIINYQLMDLFNLLFITVCTNFTYDPYDFSVTMNVMMNDNSLYQNSFSGIYFTYILMYNYDIMYVIIIANFIFLYETNRCTYLISLHIQNHNEIVNDSFFFVFTLGRNPPPVCVPVPVPYIPIRMDMCAQVFNVFTPGSNIHMCLDMMARVEKAPLIVLHFDCMRMGQDGFTLLKPEEDGGTVSGGGWSNNNGITEGETEETEQHNVDYYNEVTEDRVIDN